MKPFLMKLVRTAPAVGIVTALCACVGAVGCQSGLTGWTDSGQALTGGDAPTSADSTDGDGSESAAEVSAPGDGSTNDGASKDGNTGADSSDAGLDGGVASARDAAPVIDGGVARLSNCTVDSDCGPGRRCSPSQLNSICFCPISALCDDSTECRIGSTPVPCVCGDACGHGYFCHTERDTCNDDSDCTQSTCNYNWVDESWGCSDCWPSSIIYN